MIVTIQIGAEMTKAEIQAELTEINSKINHYLDQRERLERLLRDPTNTYTTANLEQK